MRRALVLFRGTGSVDRSLEAAGFVVDSLDIDPKFGATWTADILQWDAWKDMEPGVYDYIWSSPPCTEYSHARTTAKTPRNLEYADSIVARTLEIVRHLKPKGWSFENPGTGLLKTRDVIADIPYVQVCYCMYSCGVHHLYRKLTYIWGHLPAFKPRPVCKPSQPCALSAATGKHPSTAQRFEAKPDGTYYTLATLCSMPKALCDDIAAAAALL